MDRHDRIEQQLAEVPLFEGLSKKELKLVSQLATPLEEVGASAFRADLASARHETQYTRLFRS